MNNCSIDFRLRHHMNLNFFYNTHIEYEIVWITKGCLYVIVNGNDIPVNAGQAIFLPPYFVHAFRTDDTSESHVCEFTSALIPEKLPNEVVLFNVPVNIDNILYKVKNKDNVFTHKAALYYLLSAMSKNVVEKLRVSSDDTCLETLKFIAENFSQPITLCDAAKHLCVNYSHLSRIFKERIGLSFTECLNGTRLNHANSMLIRTNKSVTEVALACGFGSVRNFNRIFTAKFKCSPVELRKKYKSQH